MEVLKSIMSDKLSFLAEVVESSLVHIKAQCWQCEIAPPFGSLVVIEEKERQIFGLVQQVYTTSDDSLRQINAYRKTEEELLRDQPQIFTFIKTFFQVLIIGYKQNNLLVQTLSPSPVRLHNFIRQASAEEYQGFFKEHYYLNLLFNQANQIGNIDELFLALINNFKDKGIFEVVIDDFIERYALLNSADYRRLKFFLERIESSL